MDQFNSTSTAFDFELFDRRRRDEKRKRELEQRRQESSTTKSKKKSASGRKKKTSSKGDAAPEVRSQLAFIKELSPLNKVIVVVVSVCAVACVVMCLVSNSRLAAITADYDALEHELTAARHEYEAMEVEFESKMSDSAVEDYAVNVLGMQKRQNAQTRRVTIKTGEAFMTFDEPTSENNFFADTWNRMLSALGA